MNVLTKIKLNIVIGVTLLAASGILASPIVKVKNKTEGKVKFSVDADLDGGKNDMWVDPGAKKQHDTVGLRLNEVKIRYYPADGSSMLSWDHSVPLDQDYVGWGWIYTIENDRIVYAASTTALVEAADTAEHITDYKNYYWTVNMTNNSPYIAIASWGGVDDYRIIEPGAEGSVKAGTIKLFEKEGNPITLTKDDLNKKTLEINGSESKGFSLSGSGNSASKSDSRDYKNNTDNWVTYEYKENKWRILKGPDQEGRTEKSNNQNANVRIYTKEKGSIDFAAKLEATESSKWVIDANGDIKAAK